MSNKKFYILKAFKSAELQLRTKLFSGGSPAREKLEE